MNNTKTKQIIAGLPDESWVTFYNTVMDTHIDAAELKALAAAVPECPLDLVLHCPNCGLQHVDKPEPNRCQDCGHNAYCHSDCRDSESILCRGDMCWCKKFNPWLNPPHKSHLCVLKDGGCGTIWRPADVPTNGVAHIQTRGDKDTWPPYQEDKDDIEEKIRKVTERGDAITGDEFERERR